MKSGFISRNNPDETAKNFFELNEEVDLDRRLTATWNIVPWYIGTGNRIRPANMKDIRHGMPHLEAVVNSLRHLRIIVFVGRKAQRARRLLEDKFQRFQMLNMPHPSPQCINRKRSRRTEIKKVLMEIKRAIAKS